MTTLTSTFIERILGSKVAALSTEIGQLESGKLCENEIITLRDKYEERRAIKEDREIFPTQTNESRRLAARLAKAGLIIAQETKVFAFIPPINNATTIYKDPNNHKQQIKSLTELFANLCLMLSSFVEELAKLRDSNIGKSLNSDEGFEIDSNTRLKIIGTKTHGIVIELKTTSGSIKLIPNPDTGNYDIQLHQSDDDRNDIKLKYVCERMGVKNYTHCDVYEMINEEEIFSYRVEEIRPGSIKNLSIPPLLLTSHGHDRDKRTYNGSPPEAIK